MDVFHLTVINLGLPFDIDQAMWLIAHPDYVVLDLLAEGAGADAVGEVDPGEAP